ncbi:MAG TPA: hypothetical protein VFS55_01060 [Dokdonella sp.]|nr:hypothetical protein [Dokdonella sp.]
MFSSKVSTSHGKATSMRTKGPRATSGTSPAVALHHRLIRRRREIALLAISAGTAFAGILFHEATLIFAALVPALASHGQR